MPEVPERRDRTESLHPAEIVHPIHGHI